MSAIANAIALSLMIMPFGMSSNANQVLLYNNATVNGLQDEGLATDPRPEGGRLAMVPKKTFSYSAYDLNKLADDFTISGTGWRLHELTTWVSVAMRDLSQPPMIPGSMTVSIHANAPSGPAVAAASLHSQVQSDIHLTSRQMLEEDPPAMRIAPRPLCQAVFRFEGNAVLIPGTYWAVFHSPASAVVAYVGLPILNFPPGVAPTAGNATQFRDRQWQGLAASGPPNQQAPVPGDLPFWIRGTANP